MTCRAFPTVVAVALLTGWCCPVAVGQGLTVRRESPGTQTSGQTGTVTTNSFNGAPVASYTSLTGSGNGVTTGTYTAGGNGFGVFNDQFGAGSNYFSTGGRNGPGSGNALSQTATLQLSTTTYYLGIYWLAIDGVNQLDFYQGATLVGSLSASRLLADTGTVFNPGIGRGTAYNGTGGFGSGNNTGEKSAYVNIYSDNAASGFNRVVFTNTGGSGFESDSHTFATTLIPSGSQSGTLVPVPEPAGLLAATGGLCMVARRVRRR